MCFNKKVIVGLAVVAVGVVIAAPDLLLGALPLLILAACPLSMVLMMRGMRGMGGNGSACDRNNGGSERHTSRGSVPLRPEGAVPEARAWELEEEINRLRAVIGEREQAGPERPEGKVYRDTGGNVSSASDLEHDSGLDRLRR